MFPDGLIVFMYKNGDIKQCYEDVSIISFFAKNSIVQRENYKDGYKWMKFKDDHLEQINYDTFVAIK